MIITKWKSAKILFYNSKEHSPFSKRLYSHSMVEGGFDEIS